MTFLVSVFGALIGIGLLIFVHELGHYLAARAAGVRVEVFSLGFGPRLCGFVRGDTDYRISAVPLGGYVRVAGEDPVDRRNLKPDDLYSKGMFARAVFFAGGIAMNVLFALVAFPIVFGSGVSFTAPVAGSVTPGGPAWQAGLERGDRVLAVAGKRMYSFENLLVEFALAGGREPVEVEYERGGVALRTAVTPRFSSEDGLYVAGIEPPFEDQPALVTEVAPDGPAARAGLRDEDRVVAIDGRLVGAYEIGDALADLRPEQTVELTIEREGHLVKSQLTTASVMRVQPQIGVLAALTSVVAIRSTDVVRASGILVGDRVLAVNGETFAARSLGTADHDGGPVTIRVLRDGRPLDLPTDPDPAKRAALDRDVALGAADGLVVVAPRPDTPAERAGIRPGDVVRRVNDREVHVWNDLLETVRAAGTDEILLQVESIDADGNATPREVRLAPESWAIADLGFVPIISRFRESVRADGIGDAVSRGFIASSDMIKQLYVTLKRLVTGDVSARNVSGIVGISVVTYQHAQRGWTELLYLLAALSLNLAVVNLLPIPLLDGGHLLFLLIERVRGTPVSARVLNYSQVLGLVFVLALVVFVTFNDIRRLFFS